MKGRGASLTQRDWRAVSAVLVPGYGVASGTGAKSPHPAGSIELQLPHFRARGLDLDRYFLGTLNLKLEAKSFTLTNPRYNFAQIRWTELHGPEDFSFSPCRIEFRSVRYDGLIYYPHPSTKPAHYQPANVIEVLSEKIPNISDGARVVLFVDSGEVEILP